MQMLSAEDDNQKQKLLSLPPDLSPPIPLTAQHWKCLLQINEAKISNESISRHFDAWFSAVPTFEKHIAISINIGQIRWFFVALKCAVSKFDFRTQKF